MLTKSFATKSLFTALTSFACSATVMAGMFPEIEENENEGIYILGVEGQYFNQTNNLAELTNSNGASNVDPNVTHDLATPPDPEQEWGYSINAGYIFPSHKYDVQANFTSVRADASKSFGATPLGGGLGSSQITSAKTEANYDYWEADITFGNYIKRHKHLMYRLGYGIAYANIDQKSNENINQISGGNPPTPFTSTIKMDNKFWGVGPKLTFDGQFDVQKYFGVVGGIGLSALYGESKANLTLNSTGTTFGGGTISVDEKDDRIAFGVDAKLGLRFMYLINDDYAFSVESGYKGTTFFNALQGNNFDVAARGSEVGSGSFSQNENYSNYGPYANLTVEFM
jgi:hypothetical protein